MTNKEVIRAQAKKLGFSYRAVGRYLGVSLKVVEGIFGGRIQPLLRRRACKVLELDYYPERYVPAGSPRPGPAIKGKPNE